MHLDIRNSDGDPAPSARTADAGGDGWRVLSRSVSGLGLFGQTTEGGSGVLGINEGPSVHAVHGHSSAGASGARGDSVGADGVIGNTTAANKSGAVGFANNPSANGVAGINSQGTGVFDQTGATGATAAFFWNTAGGDAIRTTGNVSVCGTTHTAFMLMEYFGI